MKSVKTDPYKCMKNCFAAAVFGVAFFAFSSQAQAATINAVSCSSANVSAAIASASNGDTVAVPAGDCTWSSQYAVSIVGKSIHLAGNGIGSTNISLTAEYAARFNSSSSHVIDVTGFSFITPEGTLWNGVIRLLGDNTGSIRIHNNSFGETGAGISGYYLNVDQRSRALIDHNTFTKLSRPQTMFVTSSSYITSFRQVMGWGAGWDTNVEWVFIEDNTFNMGLTQSPSYLPMAAVMDTQNAGKWVFRHNTVNNGTLLSHNTCWNAATSTTGTGGLAYEVYDNTFIYHPNYSGYAWTEFFGGTALVHDNRLELWGNATFNATDTCASGSTTCLGGFQDSRTLQGDRCISNGWMPCDGSQNMWCSGSSDTAWYTCNLANESSPPVGYTTCATRGKGTCAKKHCSNSWNLCTVDGDCSGGGMCSGYLDNLDSGSGRVCFNGTGAGMLDDATGKVLSDPVYFWDNTAYYCTTEGDCTGASTKSVRVSNSNISNNAILNTDFFNNSEPGGYVPYTYPHPLTGGGDTTPPSNPTGLSVS